MAEIILADITAATACCDRLADHVQQVSAAYGFRVVETDGWAATQAHLLADAQDLEQRIRRASHNLALLQGRELAHRGDLLETLAIEVRTLSHLIEEQNAFWSNELAVVSTARAA